MNLAKYVDQFAADPALMAALEQKIADMKRPVGEGLFDPPTDAQLDQLAAAFDALDAIGRPYTERLPETRGMADALIAACVAALPAPEKAPPGEDGQPRKRGRQLSPANYGLPTSEAQKQGLYRRGYRGPCPATKKEASDLIQRLDNEAATAMAGQAPQL
jgi:hypothetical protein